MENVNNSGHILNEDHSPSFFQNSCTGNRSEEEKTIGEIPENFDRDNKYINARPSKVQGEIGWVKTLKCFPMLTNEILDNHLITGSSSICIASNGPKAFRNKKQGYHLWKEGYVRNIFMKPNVTAKRKLFLAKSKVHASMKNNQYTVYVHLDQINGEVMEAKCNCKAGQGGCCKHVAALLYTLLDFANLDLKQIPADMTCTQVAQKWHVPSSANMTLTKAVKFCYLRKQKMARSGKGLLSVESRIFVLHHHLHFKSEKKKSRVLQRTLENLTKQNSFVEQLNQTIACHLCILKHHVQGKL